MKLVFTLLFGLFLHLSLSATHMLGADISYRHLGGSQQKFSFQVTIYESTGVSGTDSIDIDFYQCGANIPFNSVRIGADSFTTVVGPDSVTYNKRYFNLPTYTFPGAGCYTVALVDPNRIDGIVNIPMSVNVPLCVEDSLFMLDPQFYGFNSSPDFKDLGILFTNVGDTLVYEPDYSESDGDSLVWELVHPLMQPGYVVPGYKFPAAPLFNPIGEPRHFTLNETTGKITWRVPQTAGTYSIAVKISEYRDGKLIGTMLRDMTIIVSPGVLGIETEEDHSLTITPNPAQNIVVIQMTRDKPMTINITDLSGRVFMRSSAIRQRFEVDVAQWPAGIYLVRWEDDNGMVHTQKFFKVSD